VNIRSGRDFPPVISWKDRVTNTFVIQATDATRYKREDEERTVNDRSVEDMNISGLRQKTITRLPTIKHCGQAVLSDVIKTRVLSKWDLNEQVI